MGDVVLSEPIAASLVEAGASVSLCTEYEDAGRLLASYEAVHPYSDYMENRLGSYNIVHALRYEPYPSLHYLDAYARDIGVTLIRRVPNIKGEFPRLMPEKYGLIAPHTSNWMRHMRTWPMERYLELLNLLPQLCGFDWRFLDPNDTFKEMMSHIANATLFIGNDSGPAVLAQAFSIPSIVVFGATNSSQVLFGVHACGITNYVGCNGCRHVTRHTEIECYAPECIHGVSLEAVVSAVKQFVDAGLI